MSSGRVRGGRRWCLLVLLAVVVLAAGGCSAAGDAEDLVHALAETRSGVRTAQLAVEQLQQGRTTRAAAEVTVGDMADQIGLAYRSAAEAPAGTAELVAARATTLDTIAAAQGIVLGVADGLSSESLNRGPQLGSASTALDQADARVAEALQVVEER